MPNAGTLDVGINVDPTGMIRGFGRSQAELKKFERSLNTSTRSISRGFTNLAVDFAVSGDVGVGAFKRLTQSAVGLAGVFGPAGLLVSAIGGTALTLWNFHTRAREEAEKTKKKYEEMFEGLMGAGVQAVSRAATEFERENAATINRLEANLATFQAKQAQFAKGEAVGGVAGFGAQIKAIQDQLNPLLAIRKQLSEAASSEAQAAQRLLTAESEVERTQKSRLTIAKQLVAEEERLAELRASGPAFREAVVQARIAANAGIAMPSVDTAIARAPKVADGLLALERTAQEVADSLTTPFSQLKQGFTALTAGVLDLRGAMQSAASSMLSAAAGLIQGLGAKIAGGSFLGQLGAAAGTGLGGSLLGPIGGAIGGVVGGLVGRGIGAIAKGLGKVFGFGKKRGPSPEELAAKRLQELAKAAREAAEALSNIPEGFKIALARFRVAEPRGGGPPPTSAPPPGGGDRPRKGERVEIRGNVIVVANSPEEFHRQLERGGYTRDRGGLSKLSVALMPAR